MCVRARRNGQPDGAVRTLDLISIAPVVLGELHVVVKDEQIRVMDQVEVTLPWDIARLKDYYRFQSVTMQATARKEGANISMN
jgi:hypothetical protein